MTKIIKNILATFCIITISINSLSANDSIKSANLTNKISSLIDTPYELASRYMPVLEKALSHCKVPFRAKKIKVERYVYQANDNDPLEKLIANINIERDGLLGQLITAEGKLNDMDLSYRNEFRFSVLGKGTMDVRTLLNGKIFGALNVFANKRTDSSDIIGKLLDKEINYATKNDSVEGNLGGYPYKMHIETIKDKNGEVIAIRSNGTIGTYEISGYGYKKDSKNFFIEENYGPLFIKTQVSVIS